MTEIGQPGFQQYTTGDILFVPRPGHPHRFADNSFKAISYRFQQGAQALPDAVAAELQPESVCFNEAVQRVAVGPSSVEVTTAQGSREAGYVVVALPPALAVDTIKFDPPLSSAFTQTAQQTETWMGQIVKAVAIYETPFWREMGLSGTAMSYVGPF